MYEQLFKTIASSLLESYHFGTLQQTDGTRKVEKVQDYLFRVEEL